MSPHPRQNLITNSRLYATKPPHPSPPHPSELHLNLRALVASCLGALISRPHSHANHPTLGSVQIPRTIRPRHRTTPGEPHVPTGAPCPTIFSALPSWSPTPATCAATTATPA